MPPNWTLTVGGSDVTPYVINGARFVEIASSTDGMATFTLNGSHAAVIPGASVVLNGIDGVPLWEGAVSVATAQINAQGVQIATMVQGAPLAQALDVATHYVVTKAVDVAALAQSLCAQTVVPFGSQSELGSTGGTLSIRNVSSGLSTAALLARKHWRVQNGAVAFVGPESMIPLGQPFNGTSVTASSVVVSGGLDTQTKQPLQGSFATQGQPAGPVYHSAIPELADHDTLTNAGSALGLRYGAAAITATLTLEKGTNLRAGDWFVDTSGVTAHAQRVEHALIAGWLTPTVDFGSPALSVSPQIDDTAASRAAQYPPARIANDFLVTGATLSATGLQLTLSSATIVLAGVPYTITGAGFGLSPNATSLVSANSTGYVVTDSTLLPAPGSAVPLYVVTTNATQVVGYEQVAPHGGIGSYHLKPANPNNTPSISKGSITVSAEGAASAKATVPFTINGLTLDDTIGSIEIVQSFSGLNQWGNPHTLKWSPTTTTFTDERHGLAAGQGYDLAVNILGRDGKPLNPSPLLIGTSPTITGAAIANALAAGSVGFKQFVGDTSGDTTTPIADGGNKRFLHPVMSGSVQGAIASAQASDGSYINSGQINRRHLMSAGSGLGGGNLLANPRGDNGLAGWGRYDPAGLIGWGQSGYFNGSFHAYYAGGAYDGVSLMQQTIGATGTGFAQFIPGLPMTFSAMVQVNSGTAQLQWQDSTGTSGGSTALTAGPPQLLTLTFTPSASATYILVKLVTRNTTSEAVDAYFFDVQCEYGSVALPYSDQLAVRNHNVAFDGFAGMRSSKSFNAQIPNTSAFFTDFVIEYTVTGTTPNMVLTLWFDNGTAGTDAHVYLPNYSTTPGDRDINVGHTTSTGFSKQLSGLSTNSNIYILAYYTPGSGMSFQAQATPFTIAQMRTAIQDGGYVAAYATVGTGATITVTGAGGGSQSGNGGHLPAKN